MHLAVFAEERAVGVEDRAGVVIDAGGAPFEQRSDNDDLFFFRDFRERFGGGAGNGFGEIEKVGIFLAAEIFAAKKFVHADDLRAARGRFTDFFDRAREIFVGVWRAAHLHEADCKFVCHKF